MGAAFVRCAVGRADCCSCLELISLSEYPRCGLNNCSWSWWCSVSERMGGNSPSHLSQEDEGGGVTFVKGIRLSDKVINRMRQSPTATPVPAPPVEHLLPLLTPSPCPFIATPPPSPPQEAPSTPPSVEAAPPVKLIPPPPVKFHSLPPTSVEPAAPPPPLVDPAVSAPPPSAPSPQVETPTEPECVPSPVVPVVLPPVESFVPPHVEPETPATPHIAEEIHKPVILPPPVELSPVSVAPSEPSSLPCEPVKPTPPATVEFEAPSVEPLQSAAPVQTPLEPVLPHAEPAPCELHPPPPPSPPEPVAAPPPPPELSYEETNSPCQCVELAIAPTDTPIHVPLTEPPAPPAEEPTMTTSLPPVVEDDLPVVATTPPPTAASPGSVEALEEELRQKIKAEMQRSLEEEISQRRQELQRQLEELRAQAQAEAQAETRALVEEQVKKILEVEKTANMEKLTDSIKEERAKSEDETLIMQLYRMEIKAHQLEEKEKELKKRDALYKEHVAKMEARCTHFYRVSAETFQRAKEETHNRFARYNIQPLCGDLQSQILKCYKENPGQTLSCSRIASAYIQCVDDAKKSKLSPGG